MNEAYEWTEARVSTLRRLIMVDGVALPLCAERFGISYDRIKAAATRFGFVSGMKSHASGYWNGDRIEVLKRLHAEGLSASQIASQMKNISRNAIIGKLHRLGLSNQDRPQATRPRTPAPKAKPRERLQTVAKATGSFPPTPRQAPKPAPAVRTTDVARVTLANLRPCHCRWPVGNVGSPGFGYCGLDAVKGPYCEGHAARAYVAPKNPGPKALARSVRRYL